MGKFGSNGGEGVGGGDFGEGEGVVSNAQVGAFVHAAGFFHERLLEHHLDGAVSNFTVYDAYHSIYPKGEPRLARLSVAGRLLSATAT